MNNYKEKMGEGRDRNINGSASGFSYLHKYNTHLSEPRRGTWKLPAGMGKPRNMC